MKVSWTDGIDPKTGKPVEYDPKNDLHVYKLGKPSRRQQGKLVGACPDLEGGVNYFPTTYSERTHLSYGGGIEVCFDVTSDPDLDAKGYFIFGGTSERPGGSRLVWPRGIRRPERRSASMRWTTRSIPASPRLPAA
jgi:hypothetical protein